MNAKIAKINSIGKFVGLQYHTVDNVKYIFNVIYRQVSFLVVTQAFQMPVTVRSRDVTQSRFPDTVKKTCRFDRWLQF